MQFFRKPKSQKPARKSDQRGAITVLVVLILVPTIVFEGFLVDLARLKLYGNQAIMTADNYGEAVLSVYNNVLKDLYGFFAISEDAGADALSSLKEYMPSSFTPNKNTISFGHFNGVQNAANLATKYEGFMPYSAADIELSYQKCDGAVLSNTDIFATQLGDFMRFRVVQPLLDEGSELLTALDNVMGMEANSKVIKKKDDFDEAVDEIIELSKEFYTYAKAFNQYCHDYTGLRAKNDGFLFRVNKEIRLAYQSLHDIVNDASYVLYREYMDEETAIKAAVSRRSKLKKGESLTAEETRLVGIHDRYQADPNARRNKLQTVLLGKMDYLNNTLDFQTINFGGFDWLAKRIDDTADHIARAYSNLQIAIAKLQETLKDPEVTQDLKDGIQADIDEINTLFDTGNTYSADNFKGISRMILNHSGTNGYNDTQSQTVETHLKRMEQQINAYLDGTAMPQDHKTMIDTNGYQEFYDQNYAGGKYAELYDRLAEMFGQTGGSKSAAEERTDDAETEANAAAEKFGSMETSNARDIPDGIDIGNGDYTLDPNNLAFKRLLDTAVSIFDANSLSDGFNEMMLKIYTVLYDNEMFSSRVTNAGQEDKPENERTVAESMTGYTLCREINYLFGAEIEYLFGGYKDSDANLTEARNKIVAFRAIVNFTASYSIKEINAAIKTVSTPIKAINAAVGIALEMALRVMFTMIETAQDWDELMKGEGVVLIKKQLNDMSAYSKIVSLIPEIEEQGKKTGESTSFRMKYDTYLTVMLLAMVTDDDIFSRTADLISLNVSAVESGLTKDENLTELSFDMSKAYTAVDATCSVRLDFAVLPPAMANTLLGGDTATLDKIREKGFSFTVTRGY